VYLLWALGLCLLAENISGPPFLFVGNPIRTSQSSNFERGNSGDAGMSFKVAVDFLAVVWCSVVKGDQEGV